jgi:hypothetical protein
VYRLGSECGSDVVIGRIMLTVGLALGSRSRSLPSKRLNLGNPSLTQLEMTCSLVRDSVHAHAAAALINLCEGVERDALLPYLDPIVEQLLKRVKSRHENETAKRRKQTQIKLPNIYFTQPIPLSGLVRQTMRGRSRIIFLFGTAFRL